MPKRCLQLSRNSQKMIYHKWYHLKTLPKRSLSWKIKTKTLKWKKSATSISKLFILLLFSKKITRITRVLIARSLRRELISQKVWYENNRIWWPRVAISIRKPGLVASRRHLWAVKDSLVIERPFYQRARVIWMIFYRESFRAVRLMPTLLVA